MRNREHLVIGLALHLAGILAAPSLIGLYRWWGGQSVALLSAGGVAVLVTAFLKQDR
jgi:hypothetical protein